MPIRNNSPKIFYLGKERQNRGGKRYSGLVWEVQAKTTPPSPLPSESVLPAGPRQPWLRSPGAPARTGGQTGQKAGPSSPGAGDLRSGSRAGWGHQVSSRDAAPSRGTVCWPPAWGARGDKGRGHGPVGRTGPTAWCGSHRGAAACPGKGRAGPVPPRLIHDVGINTPGSPAGKDPSG